MQQERFYQEGREGLPYKKFATFTCKRHDV